MSPPSKRRKPSTATPELTFDPDLRSSYLTGFRKRKQARIKLAQEKAVERARQDRICARAEARQRRREELEAHVDAVDRAIRIANGEEALDSDDERGDGEWTGFAAEDGVLPERIDREEEYVDEEKYTTVTVQDVSVTRHGLEVSDESSDSDAQKYTSASMLDGVASKPKKKSKQDADAKRKKRKKSFKYETKDERKLTRAKQRAKGSMQARMRKEGK